MKKVKLFEDYILTEGKITLSWNDDENSIVFSDGEIAQVDYDGEFKYRGEWFSTVDHTDAKDLIKDLQKRFKGDSFAWISEAYLNEARASKTKEELTSALKDAIKKEKQDNKGKFKTSFPTRDLREIENTKDLKDLSNSAKKVLSGLKKKYSIKESIDE